MYPPANELEKIFENRIVNKRFDNRIQRQLNIIESEYVIDRIKKIYKTKNGMFLVKYGCGMYSYRLYYVKYNENYYQFTIYPDDTNQQVYNTYCETDKDDETYKKNESGLRIVGPFKVFRI